MPNYQAHVDAALTSSILVGSAWSVQIPDTLGRVVYAISFAFGGKLGGILPDRLDPPTNPRHRGGAHSVLTGLLTVYLGIGWFQWLDPRLKAIATQFHKEWENSQCQNKWAFLKYICALFVSGVMGGCIVGYLSHLALDATTPAGLPMISA